MNKTELVKEGQALSVIDERELLGKEFRVYGSWEKPLFLAKDVANWIGNDPSQLKKMLDKVDEEEKVRNYVTTPGGVQNTWFLTEDGLYEVLMQSRKKIAKDFKKQVKHILKEVRKNGGYIVEGREMEFAKKLPTNFIEALELLVEAEKEKVKLVEENSKKQELLVAQSSKIDLYNDFLFLCIKKDWRSDSSLSIDVLRKINITYNSMLIYIFLPNFQ